MFEDILKGFEDLEDANNHCEVDNGTWDTGSVWDTDSVWRSEDSAWSV